MPLRYGKRNRRGRKPRRFRKRRGRKMRRRMRRGNKKLRALKSNIYKNGKTITTIYKTAIRVTSRPEQCNYVVLSPDPQRLVFNDTTKAPFMGDMTMYGYQDTIEAMKNAFDAFWAENRGQTGFVSDPNINTVAINALTANSSALTNVPTGNLKVPMLENYKSIVGRNTYQLLVKSAVTGANVFITLYKCKARYDINMNSFWNQSRSATSVPIELATGVLSTFPTGDAAQMNLIFNSVQNLHKIGWHMKFSKLAGPGNTDSAAGAPNTVTIADLQETKYSTQEGTTLYDNSFFLKFFKIVKKYRAELMPGQKAKLSMKQKPKFFNPFKDIPGAGSCIAKKGQVFFVLQLQGAMGHEVMQVVGNQNPYTAVGGAPTSNNAFYGGGKSRPRIGIMPAAVDVVCFKKLKSTTLMVKKNTIRNIVRVADYADRDMNDAAAPYNEAESTFYIDSAPSDYSASAAVLN